jgi:hypothetical protein
MKITAPQIRITVSTDHGQIVADQEHWVTDQDHWVTDPDHWVTDQDHWVTDQDHWVTDQDHWDTDQCHWVTDQDHWVTDQDHWVTEQDHWVKYQFTIGLLSRSGTIRASVTVFQAEGLLIWSVLPRSWGPGFYWRIPIQFQILSKPKNSDIWRDVCRPWWIVKELTVICVSTLRWKRFIYFERGSEIWTRSR